MSKINGAEQISINDITKNDLRLLSSLKHKINSMDNGFGEISLKLTIKNDLITNVKYTRIDESQQLI